MSARSPKLLLAGVPGFEPGPSVLETAMLPLTPYPHFTLLLTGFIYLVDKTQSFVHIS